MKPKIDLFPLTEHFSYAEILWNIKNISIALCPSTQVILSEEFQITGRDETLWRMQLNTSHEKSRAALYLRMLGPDQKFYCMKYREEGLMVNCYANVLDSNGEQPLKYENTFFFNYRDNKRIETFDLDDILRNLAHIGEDTLTIRCYILIDHGERVDVPADVPYGMVELSTTLEKLIKNALHPDVKVFVNKKIFYLNREMFSNVISMAKYMDMKYKQAKLLNHCEYSIETILGYVYSGNINYIIGSPRIRVAEDIERLAIPELLGAYPKEIIPLETTIEAREFVCVWKIDNLELIEKTLEGPSFDVDGTNTRWKICMHPKGKVNATDHEKKYVFLEATLLQSIKTSIDVNIEFCSLDENEAKYSRRNHKRMNVGEKLEVPFFLWGGSLMTKCLIHGNLSLRITLWISTGQITTNIGDVIRSRPFTQTNTVSLSFFSRKMRNILAGERNWDLGLISDNLLFKVHKFVLASRCEFFKTRMSNVCGQVLKLPNVKKHFIRVFLENIYTGLYCDMDFEATCHLYEFGFLFNIQRFKDRCREEIGYDIMLRVFEYAHDNNLLNLRNETFQHIINCGEKIMDHRDWQDFFNRRTELSCAVVSYWR